MAGYSYRQKSKLGIDVGRAYFSFQHKTYGEGFNPEPGISYSAMGGMVYRRQLKKEWFWETGISYTRYQLYFSTRLQKSAWDDSYPILFLPALVGYEGSRPFSFVGSAGLLFSIPIEAEAGEFRANFHPDPLSTAVDSITRGTYRYGFSAVGMGLQMNGGIRYRFRNIVQVELKASYSQGLTKLLDYDILYNNGSGKNDQHATTTSRGGYWGAWITLFYCLKK